MRWPDRLRAGKPRGWSITTSSLRSAAENRAENRYLRHLWVSRRGGFMKLALWILALLGTHSLVASDHGLLHLRALRREEAALDARHAALAEEHRQMQNEVAEDGSLSIERGLREKYRKSRPGEIIYRTKAVPPPSPADSLTRDFMHDGSYELSPEDGGAESRELGPTEEGR